MSCHQCAASFNLFRKELSCPKCGFSYCNNCLKNKIKLPNNDIKKVCQGCVEKSSNSIERQDDLNDLSKEDSSEAKPPITIMNPKKNAWSEKDLEMLKRLQSLKQKDQPSVSITTNDIAIRLANLRGESSVKSYKYVLPPKKSQEEETKDLIQRYLDESKLPTLKDTIAERLERLKNNEEEKSEGTSSSEKDISSPSGGEDEVNELMRNLTDELKIEMAHENQGNKKDEELATRLAKLRENEEPKTSLKKRTDDLIQSYIDSNCLEQLLSVVCQRMEQNKAKDEAGASNLENESDENEVSSDKESEKSEEDTDESIECEICSETATHRCHSCGNQLFCDACFLEEHDDPDEPKHRYKKLEIQTKKQ